LPASTAPFGAGLQSAPMYNRRMSHSILIVEDELDLAMVLRDYLERAGFRVQTVEDGAAALSRLQHEAYSLIILDLNLPSMDGLDVARQARRTSDIPIIMTTARVDETDRLVGLELGADDYVVKPYSPKEVVARVRAVLRRTYGGVEAAPLLQAGEIEMDRLKRRVMVGERQVELTPTEFDLLATMLEQPGRVFTRLQLLEATQGQAFEGYERSIDAHIKNLRAKIEPNPRQPRYVLTVFGVGYRFTDA
jgi:DNA-binding response OmpR family regulator